MTNRRLSAGTVSIVALEMGTRHASADPPRSKEGRKEGRKDGWMDGRMEGWKDGRMEGWKDGRMEGWKEGWKEGRKEGRMEGWKDGRMEGWKEGRKEGRINDKPESMAQVFRYQMTARRSASKKLSAGTLSPEPSMRATLPKKQRARAGS